MSKNIKTWSFPEHINFEILTHYLKKFDEENHNQKFIFNLSKTTYIHSSFIGFLINFKDKIEKKGGNLELLISPELEKFFNKINLGKFLSYTIVKKSA